MSNQEVHSPDGFSQARCRLHVCTSCRPSTIPREPAEERPGHQLHARLAAAIATDPLRECVEVVPVECMSLCPRPCAIALASKERWTYLFGDQQADTSVEDILDCLRRYLAAADGELPRAERPPSLRASILGRIPPL